MPASPGGPPPITFSIASCGAEVLVFCVLVYKNTEHH